MGMSKITTANKNFWTGSEVSAAMGLRSATIREFVPSARTPRWGLQGPSTTLGMDWQSSARKTEFLLRDRGNPPSVANECVYPGLIPLKGRVWKGPLTLVGHSHSRT